MRPTSADDLRIFRLRLRGDLLEKLLAGLYGAARAAIPATREVSSPIQLALLRALESLAQSFEQDLLHAPELSSLNDSERALLTDELREVVSELRAFVENLTDGDIEKT
jgi:hypothetical protein